MLDDNHPVEHPYITIGYQVAGILSVLALLMGLSIDLVALIGEAQKAKALIIMAAIYAAMMLFGVLIMITSCFIGYMIKLGEPTERGSRWNYVQSFLFSKPRRPSSSSRMQNTDVAGSETLTKGDVHA